MAKKIRCLFLILTAIICLNSNILAKEDNNLLEVFKTANNLYEKANYAGAIKRYQNLIDRGVKNKTVYYNLGNAYYKTNKLGQAVLNYKRAFKLSPRDKDIIANLTFAREKVVDQIKYEKPFPRIIWGGIISILTFNEWTILCGILYLLFIFLLIFCILKRNVSAEVIFYKNLIFIVLCVGIIFFISSYLTNKQLEAVITVEEAEVRNGPGENYSKGFVLHEGTEVYIENDSGNWLEIILSNGLKGWIEKDFCDSV
ncbi:MAG: tetratricopeptide repeat protein [bacterium]